MSDGSSKRYPRELRERAVRMVTEISDQDKSEWTAITEVAGLLGIGAAEMVRRWVRQALIERFQKWMEPQPLGFIAEPILAFSLGFSLI